MRVKPSQNSEKLNEKQQFHLLIQNSLTVIFRCETKFLLNFIGFFIKMYFQLLYFLKWIIHIYKYGWLKSSRSAKMWRSIDAIQQESEILRIKLKSEVFLLI